MTLLNKKWWQIWKGNLNEPPSALEKITRTYKDIAKEHKKKEFEIVTVYQKIEAAYKIVLRVLIGVLSIAVVVGFIKEYQKQELVIEPFLVYDELKKQGVEGTVLSSTIIDKINEIKEFANTSKETQAFSKQRAAKPIQIRLPVVGSGFSISGVYEQVKSALGKTPKTVSGSVIQYGKKTTLIINIMGKSFRKSIPTDSNTVDKLIDFAAITILKQTEPYLLAAYCMQKKDYDQAIEISRYCLTHEPQSDDKWAYLILGRAEFMKGNEDSAIEYCKKAITLDKKFAYAYTNWGVILQLSRKGPNYEAAIQKYKEAIKINPKYIAPHLNWGTILQAQKKYNEALEKLKTAYELDKNDKFIPHRIGNVYFEMRKYDEAIEWYKKSIDIAPDFIDAYWGIIESIRDKKYQIDESFFLSVVEDALELNPYSIIPYFESKELYKYLHKNVKLKEALKQYYEQICKNKQSILTDYKDDKDMVLSLAVSLRELEDYKIALQVYENVIQAKDYEIEGLYGMLICYTRLNMKKEAVRTMEKLLEIDPETKEYFYYQPVLLPYLAHPKVLSLQKH
ncbi:MAG: tetratricopeptide repeat protein [Bacteroidia bacterium]|nr:tetratricopeptide repeat protein [Bacteroidia bacterium]